MRRIRVQILVALVIAIAAAVALVRAQAPADERQHKSAATECAAVKDLRWPEVRISEAIAVKPGERRGISVGHCRVSGVIEKDIKFTLLLPDDWNRRFFMGGGGGYVGSVQNAAGGTVNAGYATVGTDTGHESDGMRADWALNNLERQLNFGYLAVHRTAVVAKAIVHSYYGSDARYSYFHGCSNGGRQAMMESQRYPDDFDGVIAGAPAFNWTNMMSSMARLKMLFPDPTRLQRPVITADNLKLLQSKILDACDTLDGVKDGVMEDPRACTFNVASLPACPGDKAGPQCVTKTQRAAIDAIYAPLVDREGPLYPGIPYGGEVGDGPNGESGGWQGWITGTDEKLFRDSNGQFPSAGFAFATEFFKYFVFGDPSWDYRRFDPLTARAVTRQATFFLNAVDTDLGRFKARGGKLILFHGWSDPGLSALATLDYYRQVETRDANARDYARLFLMPGVLHCSGGPGPVIADWPTAIADWVERGKAPDRIVAAKANEDRKIVRTRPLCPFPQRAVYTGKGSTDDAANFVCKTVGT